MKIGARMWAKLESPKKKVFFLCFCGVRHSCFSKKTTIATLNLRIGKEMIADRFDELLRTPDDKVNTSTSLSPRSIYNSKSIKYRYSGFFPLKTRFSLYLSSDKITGTRIFLLEDRKRSNPVIGIRIVIRVAVRACVWCGFSL